MTLNYYKNNHSSSFTKLFSLVCLCFTTLFYAQTVYQPETENALNEPWRWNNFPEIESDGLRCMTQTKDGKFLFGTNHGVLSYDGINWKYVDSIFSDKTVNNLFLDLFHNVVYPFSFNSNLAFSIPSFRSDYKPFNIL